MPDYSKQTVAQLRQLLKDRSIPSTGLTRKAQIIEKLEEADSAATTTHATESNVDGAAAPSNGVDESLHQANQDHVDAEVQVSRTPVEEAGGPDAKLARDTEPEVQPVPVATIDSLPETISHIDNVIHPEQRTKAIKESAGDTANAKEPAPLQPIEIFDAPPADLNGTVGPAVTELTDAPAGVPEEEELATDPLPDAPGPAAEDLCLASQKHELPQGLQDNGMDDKTASPAPNEKQSVEKPELLPIPEQSTAETSRLNSEELEADSKKRKRRSDTPEMGADDIKAKKHRPSQELAPEIYLKEDKDIDIDQRRTNEVDMAAAVDNNILTHDNHANPGKAASPAGGVELRREKKENSARYKDLVNTGADDTPLEALTDDRPTIPAIHPVTPALYIRNFMRPLRPEPLRAHLISLASPPSSSPDPTIIKSLFLDAMKTHALVLFSSTIAASRVRASLHGSIWPPEGNRKELWVDFVPEEHVEAWIKQEEDAIEAEKEARTNGRSSNPKRFEVVYPESSDGSITAVFQEVGSSAPFNAPKGPRASLDVRRPSIQQYSPPSLPPGTTKDVKHDTEAPFKTLHDLFCATVAKPQIFYLPVSDETSELRLKELDAETSRDWAPGEVRKGRGIKNKIKYKYSFDEDDRIVEVGEDRGPWSEGYRGGRRGFRGRGRGGGFRARGDNWRG
ncbi:SAP domain containing protein [Pyrenophora tritici-repentis]|uniref:SAP domain containing protein n=2 Tax=Pyrenophora tritici-repentis TaxID=45151 RepID=A0A2W1F558_9PLEO|nr:SAP domain containing protein [Pyrenophora tritici-repentis Pt-1C-BFP]KAA8617866.1 SAP domain-containing protein [Pyrenophora tritici-repentis]EDU42721.1 SAP domain containing protein [Pyrenophora tritici-repentis Pt-1C-BFP]KAF7443182.1 SAP domain containing protein [Pyrenophora tritici-repentis]KAF7568347.1 SAP domain containing protein [Pyrenophora tritici-repentis]KAG9377143.1 SAP domain containing protein [Pyrenophora tritici-repentis]